MSGPVNINDIPLPILYQLSIYPVMQKMVGHRYKIVHLTPDRNGKICEVRGYDRTHLEVPLLHCYFEHTSGGEEEEMVKLKIANLVPLNLEGGGTLTALETFMAGSAPITDQVLRNCLEASVRKYDVGGDVRPDLMHRIGLYKRLLAKLMDTTSTPALTDADYSLACGAGHELLGDDGYARVTQLTKPACFGNLVCDLRYMDIGLKGDGVTDCRICQEILAVPTDENFDQVLVTLPCLHVFHEGCMMSWLDSRLGRMNWNCPSCRKTAPNDISVFCVNYEEQLQRRYDEYLLSGFCTKCMIITKENQRLRPWT